MSIKNLCAWLCLFVSASHNDCSWIFQFPKRTFLIIGKKLAYAATIMKHPQFSHLHKPILRLSANRRLSTYSLGKPIPSAYWYAAFLQYSLYYFIAWKGRIITIIGITGTLKHFGIFLIVFSDLSALSTAAKTSSRLSWFKHRWKSDSCLYWLRLSNFSWKQRLIEPRYFFLSL